MIFTKFHENRLIIDGKINEKHALLVECGQGYRSYAQYREPRLLPFKKYLLAKIFFFYFYSTH